MKKYSEEIERFLSFIEQCKTDLKEAEQQEVLAVDRLRTSCTVWRLRNYPCTTT